MTVGADRLNPLKFLFREGDGMSRHFAQRKGSRLFEEVGDFAEECREFFLDDVPYGTVCNAVVFVEGWLLDHRIRASTPAVNASGSKSPDCRA